MNRAVSESLKWVTLLVLHAVAIGQDNQGIADTSGENCMRQARNDLLRAWPALDPAATPDPEFFNRLAGSDRASDRAAMMIMASRHPELRDAVLERTLQEFPDDPLVISTAASLCDPAQQPWCGPEIWERWIDAEPENFQPYLLLAAEAARNGDQHRVDSLLQAAGTQGDHVQAHGTLAAALVNAAYSHIDGFGGHADATSHWALETDSMAGSAWVNGLAQCTLSDSTATQSACVDMATQLSASGTTVTSMVGGASVLEAIGAKDPLLVGEDLLEKVVAIRGEIKEHYRPHESGWKCEPGAMLQFLEDSVAMGELEASILANSRHGSQSDDDERRDRTVRNRRRGAEDRHKANQNLTEIGGNSSSISSRELTADALAAQGKAARTRNADGAIDLFSRTLLILGMLLAIGGGFMFFRSRS